MLKINYTRQVNPKRVQLATDLVIDKEGNSSMTASAQYALKSSTLNLSINSDLMLKSSIEVKLSQGVQFQLAGEALQAKDHFKFGYALIMG
jgi:hypothetical protein